jgi:subtilisin family serine protease
MKSPKFYLLCLLLISFLFQGCGSSAIIYTPIENIDDIPLKHSPLTEDQQANWRHLDLKRDTVPGMSVDRAYAEIIGKKKGEEVIVAIIDSGIDISHEDLDDVIWINSDEIPNNNKDDDNNGYVDDIYGWNFLGDAYNEQFEYVRLLASMDKTNPRYEDAQQEYEKNVRKYGSIKKSSEQIYNQLKESHQVVSNYLDKSDYTREDLNNIENSDAELMNHAGFLKNVFFSGYGSPSSLLKILEKDLITLNEYLSYHLNLELDGRAVVGDDPNNFNDRDYGNPNVKPIKESESHGTHVAGIVAAERDNGMGVKGVAKNVKIMSLRTVPNGDEYDKDVALAIRYAVDNGAKVINMSFGKYFSPNPEWVHEAITYAASKDVLIVAGAGNESYNIDEIKSFPNDENENGKEITNNYIVVGATGSQYGSNLVASYSNYGKKNVDIYAPGSDILSTTPNNNYEKQGGTSMASPGVAGIAAMVRSFYPKLSATQVKEIVLKSGLQLKTKVSFAGEIKSFEELSKSARLANLYNALLLASKY